MEPENKQVQPGSLGAGLVQLNTKRHEDFTTLYANHITLEPSFWDLKIYFGELDQKAGGTPENPEPISEVHTGMNISWALAKVMSYLLNLYITAYELEHGKIKMPLQVLPELPPPQTDDPGTIAVYEKLRAIRERFIAEMT